ncbi:pyrroline-5-carboxylate reductase dimerization domain-containing protein [Sphingomonas sp.]|uniref:pyrroline-5-carboxylate reductase family protein n=1 Tax=Sphingomonas sp. TaxID=28214 RepID=UPI00286A8092|nr:pyrroline-5-carboxylate reductase dimerization domain-containing protein [Sphingomonas sp.]
MSVDLLPGSTWFVGCGNMAGAMVEGWRSAGVELSQAVAIRPSGKLVEGVRTVQSVGEAGRPPKVVILGFKPQKLDEIAPQLASRLSAQTVIVSILAGVEVASLRSRFPGAAAIVRAMPNLPVAVRRGVIGLYSADADDALRQQLKQLFTVLGMVAWTASEAELAAIGAVAGAGPAYVARFIAALAKAGVQRGLDPDIAATVALETVFGTGWLAAANGEGMAAIARRVASPNGTTEAGLAVLDQDDVFDALIGAAITAAARRGGELAEAARSDKVAVATSLP